MLNQYSTDDSTKPETLIKSDPHSTDKDTLHKPILPFTEPHTKHHPKYGAVHKDWKEDELKENEKNLEGQESKSKQANQ